MTWIDRALAGRQREKRKRDRRRQREDAEYDANVRMSWNAWPAVIDEFERAVGYLNQRVEKKDHILLRRNHERELEVSHKRRPSLRLLLMPETKTIKCEICYRNKGWDSDTLHIMGKLGGVALLGREGKQSLRRTVKRWIRRLIEDIEL
jgi:hypothetical protein